MDDRFVGAHIVDDADEAVVEHWPSMTEDTVKLRYRYTPQVLLVRHVRPPNWMCERAKVRAAMVAGK